jgi:ferrous iron transport protein A
MALLVEPGPIHVPTEEVCALPELSPGESGRVVGLRGAAETCNRLMEMGVTRGTLVRFVRCAPLGDPLELYVRGYRLSLRRAEAAAVAVEPL